MMRWLLVAAVLFVAGCGAVAGSPEQVAVREWLRENTDTGKWEEVEWWESNKSRDGDVIVRLKYRATEAGKSSPEVFDVVFFIDPKRAVVQNHTFGATDAYYRNLQ